MKNELEIEKQEKKQKKNMKEKIKNKRKQKFKKINGKTSVYKPMYAAPNFNNNFLSTLARTLTS